MNFVTIDRVLNKFYRSIRNTELAENDLIEWAGEALDFLSIYQNQEKAVAFVEVKDFKAPVPLRLLSVLQLAKDNQWSKDTCETNYCTKKVVNDCANSAVVGNEIFEPLVLDCNGKLLNDVDLVYYRPYFDLKWEWDLGQDDRLFSSSRYTPIRLSNHQLFNTLVCKSKQDRIINCVDEYTINGTTEKVFTFSFREGYVLINYMRIAVDSETGYPLIPDDISALTAIDYYIKWKIAEYYFWENREGSASNVDYNEKRWLKYVKQAKNKAKMPKTIDEYQNLLDQAYHMIPRHKSYYGFFGNVGRADTSRFRNR